MTFPPITSEQLGQSALQLSELTLALVLSTIIGLEREMRMKSAGLRTHTLVGVAAALIMLVSKYAFSNVLAPQLVVLDPSRVAAQIVSGIGFIGGGLIFVQRDIVRGLTTAAAIWLTAAVGMACGGGLPVLAVYVTGIYLLVMLGYSRLTHRLNAHKELLIHYYGGKGAVHEITKLCSGRAFTVNEARASEDDLPPGDEQHALQLRLIGRGDLNALVLAINDIPSVTLVRVIGPEGSKESPAE